VALADRHYSGEALGPVDYPMTVSEAPVGLGDGTWLTSGEGPFHVPLWSLSG
jgi:hypothetical protein